MSTISHLDPNETVVNLNDHMLPFAAACVMMDDDLREELAMDGGFETNQDWFTNYENRHIEKFGEIWELSKANPTW